MRKSSLNRLRLRITIPFAVTITMFLNVSCDNGERSPQISTRDVILHDYFTAIDSFPHFSDTLKDDFKFLKAYYKNDTTYLRDSYKDLIRSLRTWDDFDTIGACQFPRPIELVNFREAYRFMYQATFCDTFMIMTIGKQQSAIIAEILLYKADSTINKCVTVKRLEKKLDQEVWQKLLKGIRYADFWGLKADNNSYGLDGSHLDAFAFQAPVNAFRGRYKAVYRFGAERTAIGAVFKDMMDATGVNVSCFHYNNPE